MGNEWILHLFACGSVLAAGLMSAAALGEQRGYPWKLSTGFAAGALLLVALCGSAGILNLGRPQLVIGALRNPGSGIFWELVFSMLFFATAAGYAAANIRGAEETTLKILSAAAALAAAGITVGLGLRFYMPWRAAWSTLSLCTVFLGWALSLSGFAFTILRSLAGEAKDDPVVEVFVPLLGRFLVLAYPAALILAGSEESQAEIDRCLTGELAALFWGAVILAGLVVPTVLSCVRSCRNTVSSLIGIAAALTGTAFFMRIITTLGAAQWHFFQ